jgi:putative tricarboxylic transport membrane protein
MEIKTETGPTTRMLELITAIVFIVLGAVVISDSVRVGMDWGDDGPKAGYFPFYIGCILCVCGAIVVAQTLKAWRSNESIKHFATFDELKLVMVMLLPTLAYVFAVTFLGIYAASAAFIFVFMVWQGKYGWLKAAVVSLSVPAVLFALFEIWFLVPLPKGPLEKLLGY